MSSYYYSCEAYFLDCLTFIGSVIFIRAIIFELLFHIPTYVDENNQTKISPKGTIKFFKVLSLLSAFGLVYAFFELFLPLLYLLPEIFSNHGLQVKGEVLTACSNIIFLFWLVVLIVLLIRNTNKIIKNLTNPIKKSKEKITIYMCNKENSIIILGETFIAVLCLLLMLGFKTGFFSEITAKVWDILVIVEMALILIEGIYSSWKIVIYNNGLVTCTKYFQEGFFTKNDILVEFHDKTICIYFRDNKSLRSSYERHDTFIQSLNELGFIER